MAVFLMYTRLLRIFLAYMILGCSQGEPVDLNKIIDKRPASAGAMVDHVGLLADVRESTARTLATIKNRYGIEILIVALPSLKNRYTVNEAAAELFTNWEIGKANEGRGILLLFVDDEKKVKLEVSYDLEDVFTDAFTGHIQDVQLQPRYAADQLEIGFIAVMEALEYRAQVKYGGDYTPASIAAIDLDYLSQGAGAGRNLETYQRRADSLQPPSTAPVNTAYPAGATPTEAWQTMLHSWRDRVNDPNLGVYTPLTRLAFRDFTHRPDASLEKDYTTYASKSYTVRQEGDVAAIYFGKKEGWNNAPFLLCRTVEGWQFDIVHQRRFIRMGKAPHWGVEFSEHPHMRLLMDTFFLQGQDIPVEDDDLYTIARDQELADRILFAEALVKNSPDDTDALLELGRLYAITAMGSKAIPLLKRVLRQSPDSAAVMKYLAIAHVDAHYQYNSALALLADYVKKAPQDPFGHNFSGYLFYRKKDYKQAKQAFENTLSIDPDNAYAHFYLTYTYAGLYSDASALNPMKKSYRQRFNRHKEKMRSFAATHPLRVAYLNRWLE
jgi:tetratricopeptide (TPR) repeat protein